MRGIAKRACERVERTWLKRWYLAPRMKGVQLEVRLDLTSIGGQVRAEATFAFRPQVTSRVMACGMGDVDVRSATWEGQPVKARSNAPYLVLRFPRRLEAAVQARVHLKYTYRPDHYGTIRQPITGEDFPETVHLTCRRPLLALCQGRLVKGTENPPLRTYEWQPPRSRRLNAIVADVRSFKKEAPDGTAIWLHLHADSVDRAPRLLDLLIETYVETAKAHQRRLPYTDYHVIESDERDLTPFNSAGLIVVPRGSFRTGDKPQVYGIIAPELNKEWGRR